MDECSARSEAAGGPAQEGQEKRFAAAVSGLLTGASDKKESSV